MANKDYYMILGVGRDASQNGIRAAFRELVKRYHPDNAGARWKRQFQDIIEAYETLGDPVRRRSYDLGMRAREKRTVPVRRSVVVDPVGAGAPEPLIPEPFAAEGGQYRTRDFFPMHLERFVKDLWGLGVPRAESPLSLNFEVELTPGQAVRGSRISIMVPVYYPCPACRGDGLAWVGVCPQCRGRGMVVEGETVALHVPPGVSDGAFYEVPVRGLGLYNFYLGVSVRISGGG